MNSFIPGTAFRLHRNCKLLLLEFAKHCHLLRKKTFETNKRYLRFDRGCWGSVEVQQTAQGVLERIVSLCGPLCICGDAQTVCSG